MTDGSRFAAILRRAKSHALAICALAALSAAAMTGTALADSSITTLEQTSSKTTIGNTATFTATVQGGAKTGSVKFKDGGKKIGTAGLSANRAQSSLDIGDDFGCALTALGAVFCWGDNGNGQIGIGAAAVGIDQPTPVQVTGLSSGVVQIAVGYDHACALTDAGALFCWGDNFDGQLGDGTTTDQPEPVSPVGLPANIVSVSAGDTHTCVLTQAGDVYCWGNNTAGRLGDGTDTNRPAPTKVIDLPGPVAQISAGDEGTCALTEAGAALCWGDNDEGQLGNGTTTDSFVPTPVTGLPSGVREINTNDTTACAVMKAGTVRCWGDNDDGELGDGTNTSSFVPVEVVGLTDAVKVSAGDEHTCAFTKAGAAYCWGSNDDGQLGNNSTTDSDVPVAVSGLEAGTVALQAGDDVTCALTDSAAAFCWGSNTNGEVGDGTVGDDRLVPKAVLGFGPRAARVPYEAVFKAKDLPAGKHKITAAYNGNASFDASTSGKVVHTVLAGKTKVKKIKTSPTKPKTGAFARVTVNMNAVSPAKGKPEGKVTVKDGKTKLGTFKVKKGKASFKTRFALPGKHTLKATFKGDSDWKNSGGKTTVRVKN